MSKVQSVVFMINEGWTHRKATKWLKAHGFKISFYGKQVDRSVTNELRYRQAAPSKFSKYITKKLENGIMLIIGFE